MEALLNDLTAHNIQSRTVAIIENGSWAPASGGLMRKTLEKCKNINILDNTLTIRSSLTAELLVQIHAMADAIIATMEQRG